MRRSTRGGCFVLFLVIGEQEKHSGGISRGRMEERLRLCSEKHIKKQEGINTLDEECRD